MVKPGPFHDQMFDFSSFEKKLNKGKQTLENKPQNANEQEKKTEKDMNAMLENQLSILEDVQFLLTEIEKNMQKKKGWLSFKK